MSPTKTHKAMIKKSRSLFLEELCTCWRAWRRCSVALCVARCAVLRLVSMTLSCSPCYPTISLMCWKMSWMSRTFYAISLVYRCRYAMSSSYKSLSKIIFCVSCCCSPCESRLCVSSLSLSLLLLLLFFLTSLLFYLWSSSLSSLLYADACDARLCITLPRKLSYNSIQRL